MVYVQDVRHCSGRLRPGLESDKVLWDLNLIGWEGANLTARQLAGPASSEHVYPFEPFDC